MDDIELAPTPNSGSSTNTMEGAAAAPGMGAGAAAAPGMGAGGSPSRKPLKATPAELAPVAEMLWVGAASRSIRGS